MFPVFYDRRLVGSAVTWLELGRPPIVPIYIRNLVRVTYSTHTGEFIFKPMHEAFFLVEGVEAPIGEKPEEGWISDYPLCVNNATWPANPFSEDGLKLITSVDPNIAKKVTDLTDQHKEAIIRARSQEALRRAFIDYHKTLPRSEETFRSKGNFDRGSLMHSGPGMLFDTGDYLTGNWLIAYYDPPKKNDFYGHVVYACIGKKPSDKDYTVSTSRTTGYYDESLIPATAKEVFEKRLEELKALAYTYMAEAEEGSLTIQFPEVAPLENGYPEAKMPYELEVSIQSGTLASQPYLNKWHSDACVMAEALGYVKTSYYQSNTARSRTARFMLPGSAHPMQICSLITKVDWEKGILYARPSDMGRVIGTGGANIKKIQQLTNKRWQVRPES